MCTGRIARVRDVILLDSAGVDLVGGGIDVAKHRDRAVHQDRLRRRDKRVGRQNDLIARTDPELGQRRDQRVRSIDHGQAALGTHGLSPALFKFCHRGGARPDAAAQALEESGFVMFRYPARPRRPLPPVCFLAAQQRRQSGTARLRRMRRPAHPKRASRKPSRLYERPANHGSLSFLEASVCSRSVTLTYDGRRYAPPIPRLLRAGNNTTLFQRARAHPPRWCAAQKMRTSGHTSSCRRKRAKPAPR